MIDVNVKNLLNDELKDSEIGNQQPSLLSDKVEKGSTTREDSSLVCCEICGKQFRTLWRHLLVAHNLSAKDYKKMYPNAIFACQEYTVLNAAHNKKIRNECWTEQSLLKMRLSQSKRMRNRTPEQLKRQTEISKRAIKAYWNASPEVLKRNLSRQKEKLNARIKSDPVLQKVKHDNMIAANNMRLKRIESMSAEEKLKYWSPFIRHGSKKYVFNHNNVSYTLRSSYEMEVVKYLVDNKIPFKYEEKFISNGSFNYLPDFIVNRTILEVSSMYRINKYLEGYTVLRPNCAKANGYEYMLLSEKEIFNKDTMQQIIGRLLQECTTSCSA